MEVRQNDDVFREKEWFRAKIEDMIKNINNTDILIYIYKITCDIIKEDDQVEE